MTSIEKHGTLLAATHTTETLAYALVESLRRRVDKHPTDHPARTRILRRILTLAEQAASVLRDVEEM